MVLVESSTQVAQATDILNTMFRLCKHLSLYSEDNSVVTQATHKLMHNLRQFQGTGEVVHVTVSKHGFLFNGEFLNQKNLLFNAFAQRMFQLGLSSFTLTPELSVSSLYAFLHVLMRNAAEIWDEGGVGASLQNQHLVGILFTEMSENDFRLLNATPDEEHTDSLQHSADPWGKLSRSLANTITRQGLGTFPDEELSSAELAERISRLLVGNTTKEQEVLTRRLSRFAASLQREKLKTTRTAAILNLAEFVNHLSADLRGNVMNRICNLQMSTEYAEDFLSGLSDSVILDSFRQASGQPEYTTPVIMSLISKLASTRKLVPDAEVAAQLATQNAMSSRIKELLKPDEFKKYVPSRYQQVLLQVLNKQRLPSDTNEKLQKMKKSFEDFQQERQLVRLSLAILSNDPEADSVAELRSRLLNALQSSLDAADFVNLVDLCRLCFADKTQRSAMYLAGLVSEAFVGQVLGCVPVVNRNHLDYVAEVIELIGLPFARPLIDASTLEADRSIRYFYLNCLKKLGPQVTDQAVLSLKDEQWFVQRNMLILLGELNAVDKLPQIRTLLKHTNLKVRQEALKTCLLLHDGDSIQSLIKGLSSENRQEALHAITLSHLVDNPVLSAKLLRMLEKKELFRFDFDMKKALVQALSDHQWPQALSVFSEILISRRIFQAGLHRKLKVEILKSLGKYPVDQVSNLLKSQLGSRTKEIANQARLTLKKLLQEEI